MQEDTLWSNIFKQEKKEKVTTLTILKRVPVFRDLKLKELRALERILHRRTYRDGEQIVSEGETGIGMYIIESGKVLITLGEEKKVLAVLINGEFFGEMALFLESPRTASAIASGPVKLLGFFQSDLFSLLETHPKTGNKILQRLAQMISERLRLSSIENRQLKNKLNELKAELDQLKEESKEEK